jgi:hypothetical protein
MAAGGARATVQKNTGDRSAMAESTIAVRVHVSGLDGAWLRRGQKYPYTSSGLRGCFEHHPRPVILIGAVQQPRNPLDRKLVSDG